MPTKMKDDERQLGRRTFLRNGSGVAAGLMFGGRAFAQAQEVKPTKPAAKPAEEAPATPVGCAVIGLGEQGREIIKALAVVPGADVKYVCDTFAGVHNRAKERAPKAQAVAEYRKVLDDKSVQAVWIATPTHMHKDIALAALQAGKHVYCEAPLAHTMDDARAIALAAVKAPKQIFQAGLQRRVNHLERHVYGFFKTGVLSKLAMARSHWNKKTSWRRAGGDPGREQALNWRLDRGVSTGLIGEVGIHQLDTANLFLRQIPWNVQGMGSTMVWKDGRQVHDTVQAVFEYAGGLRYFYSATLGNSFESDVDVFQGSDAAVMLHKDRAWLFKESDAPNLGWEVYATKENIGDETGIALVANATKLLDEGKDPSENKNAYTKGPLYYGCETFLNAVRTGTRSPAGPAEGLAATVVAIKANEAINTGTKISFRREWFALS